MGFFAGLPQMAGMGGILAGNMPMSNNPLVNNVLNQTGAQALGGAESALGDAMGGAMQQGNGGGLFGMDPSRMQQLSDFRSLQSMFNQPQQQPRNMSNNQFMQLPPQPVNPIKLGQMPTFNPAVMPQQQLDVQPIGGGGFGMMTRARF